MKYIEIHDKEGNHLTIRAMGDEDTDLLALILKPLLLFETFETNIESVKVFDN